MKKLLIMVLFMSGCARQQAPYTQIVGEALGTTYSLTVQVGDAAELRQVVDSVFVRADASMSVYNHDSRLSRLNRNETDTLDAEIAHCIEVAREVGALSGGVYDITLKPVIDAWGFNTAAAQEAPNLDSLMQFAGWDKIKIEDGRLLKADPRVQIDLNSVAKGYTVDMLAEAVERMGALNYMLEVGGEIVCRGSRPSGGAWRVGIDKPVWGNMTPDAMRQTVVDLGGTCGGTRSRNGETGTQRQALATSGNYRRYRMDADGRPIVHTIDGRTGQSRPTDMLSATVIAPSCAQADAMATMFMAVGSVRAIEIARSLPNVRVYFVFGDNEVFDSVVSD